MVVAVIVVALVALATLAASQPANAHIKDEALKQRYLSGVSGQRSIMDSFFSTVDQALQTAEALTDQMDAVVPPMQTGDDEIAEQIALSARSQFDVHEPWHEKALDQTPEDIADWAKLARRCFKSAADRRALRKHADALTAGFRTLLTADGDVLDALLGLAKKDVDSAKGDLMAADLLRARADKMIDAALKALRNLA